MRCRPSVRTMTGKRSSPYLSARLGQSGGRMWAWVSILSIPASLTGVPDEDPDAQRSLRERRCARTPSVEAVREDRVGLDFVCADVGRGARNAAAAALVRVEGSRIVSGVDRGA